MSCRLVAQAMQWTVESHAHTRKVRSVLQLDELLSEINTDCPRVILLDEQFASAHLQTIARQLPIRLGECFLALFADRLSSRQLHMASANVSGLLSRETSVQTFVGELAALSEGRKVISESLQSKVKVNGRKRFEVQVMETVQNLTNRQLEVLVRIAEGMSAKEAAHDLHITEKAVESHKYRLMKLLGVRDRIDLCRWAIREGIINA